MMRKAPSFTGLRPASAASSNAKRKNRRQDTIQELLLRRALWGLGLRYRKNVKSLPGKPDIVFLKASVAVFCDGDFWHGRKWKSLKSKLVQGTNAGYWLSKIASNMKRDRLNTKLLESNGWHVIRLWETDIKKDPAAAAQYISNVVRARQHLQKGQALSKSNNLG